MWPGNADEQVKGICTRLEEIGIGETNGSIQDIGSGFVVLEGFNWAGLARFVQYLTCRPA